MPKSKVIKLNSGTKVDEKVVELLVGASGTQFFTGFYNISDADEYNPDLKGKKALDVYNQMKRSDGQVKQALLVLLSPIMDAECKIVPPGNEDDGTKATPQEIQNTEYIKEDFFSGEFQWGEKLKQILGFFGDGFSMFEKLYVYDGSRIRLKRLCQRIATSIVSWDVQNEELVQVKQYIYAGTTKREVWIPAEKLVLFILDREGDDFRGNSALRPAYKHWFYKSTLERIQAMQIERWALGIPKIEQTDSVVGNPNKAKAIEMAKNLRAHEEAFAYVPKGFKLELLDSGTSKMIDPKPAIEYHDVKILSSVMASFLQLGQTSHGTQSLGTTLMDMYLKTLKVRSNYIAEVIENSIFKEMTDWNFGPNVRPPKMQFNGIESADLELIANAFGTLVDKGVIETDDKLEGYIRNKAGAPQKDMKTVRKKPGLSPNPNEPGTPGQTPAPQTTAPQTKSTAKVRAAVRPPMAEQPGYEAPTYINFWRPLRPSEENVSLREIVGKLDDVRERIVKVTRESRAQVVDDLTKQIASVVQLGDPKAINTIDYSDTLKRSLVDNINPLLQDLVNYGKDQVSAELARQKKMTAAFPTVGKKQAAQIMKDYLDSKAEQFAEISLDKLVNQARTEAADAIRTGNYDAGAVRDELEAFSENAVRTSAGYAVNEAFSFGREQQASDMSSQIDHAEYSAVLDQNTCPNCEALDGQDFDVDSPEYDQNSPPLATCDGGSLCRCIWVYVGNAETTPQA